MKNVEQYAPQFFIRYIPFLLCVGDLPCHVICGDLLCQDVYKRQVNGRDQHNCRHSDTIEMPPEKVLLFSGIARSHKYLLPFYCETKTAFPECTVLLLCE